MLATEFFQEKPQEYFADFEDPFEEEETLSLCDLPIYGGDDDDSSRGSQGSSPTASSSCSSSMDDDFAEFSFSSSQSLESFNSSTDNYPPENIIFCGKLIPWKETSLDSSSDSPRKGHGLKGKLRSPSALAEANVCKSIRSSKLNRKPSAVAKPSKWYLLLMFGLAGFQGEMELRDIKKRQNKRSPPSMFGSNGGGDLVKSDRVKGNGMWSLLRAFGCANQSANSMVKASLGCVQVR